VDEQVIDPCKDHDQSTTGANYMVLQEMATSDLMTAFYKEFAHVFTIGSISH
jgi:hypothetical protein